MVFHKHSPTSTTVSVVSASGLGCSSSAVLLPGDRSVTSSCWKKKVAFIWREKISLSSKIL